MALIPVICCKTPIVTPTPIIKRREGINKSLKLDWYGFSHDLKNWIVQKTLFPLDWPHKDQ